MGGWEDGVVGMGVLVHLDLVSDGDGGRLLLLVALVPAQRRLRLGIVTRLQTG